MFQRISVTGGVLVILAAAFMPASVATAQPNTRPAAPERQVAEEATRQLLHMGINFNKARLTQPYDPLDNLC